MYWNEPKKGDVVYEYVPHNLNSNRKCWIKHKWQDLEYFKMRYNAGLIYKNFDELEHRISFEQKMNHRIDYIASLKPFSKLMDDCLYIGQKEFKKQYMCDWKCDKDWDETNDL